MQFTLPCVLFDITYDSVLLMYVVLYVYCESQLQSCVYYVPVLVHSPLLPKWAVVVVVSLAIEWPEARLDKVV